MPSTVKLPVVMKPIDDVAPAEYNPRVKLTPRDREYQQLKSSLERFGLVEPLVVNKRTGVLVGGHQRLTVMRDLGMEEVPVVEVDVNDVQERQLNVALNRLKGRWDNRQLSELLLELSAADAVASEGILDATGFTQNEVDDVLRRADAESAQSVLDRLLDEPPADPPLVGDEPAEKQENEGPASSTGSTGQVSSKWFSHAITVRLEDKETIIQVVESVRVREELQTPAMAFVSLLRWWENRFAPSGADNDSGEV